MDDFAQRHTYITYLHTYMVSDLDLWTLSAGHGMTCLLKMFYISVKFNQKSKNSCKVKVMALLMRLTKTG